MSARPPFIPLVDVQMEQPGIALPINRAGIKGIKMPLLVQDRQEGSQATIADVDLAVDLPASLKGTHMSRLVVALDNFDEVLTHTSLRRLLGNIRLNLLASCAFARFSFPFLVRKAAPATGKPGRVACACVIEGKLDEHGQTLVLRTATPVMTVCPCSMAISSVGAHSQRATVSLEMGIDGLFWIEEFIEISEVSASSAVYSLLKREDEKMVTEKAFSNPMFVEDVARNVSARLLEHPRVLWFSAEVESLESIHGHNAFARIEHDKTKRN